MHERMPLVREEPGVAFLPENDDQMVAVLKKKGSEDAVPPETLCLEPQTVADGLSEFPFDFFRLLHAQLTDLE